MIELDDKEIRKYLEQLKFLIEDLDRGNGVSIEELKELMGLKEEVFNYLLRILIQNGEIMEVEPGKVKLLK